MKKESHAILGSILRDYTSVGYPKTKSDLRRRIEEYTNQRLAHQNKRFNKICEEKVNEAFDAGFELGKKYNAKK